MRVSSPIPHKKGRIEIIPLIDIMFFLLASFMMVSLSQVHMKGIKVNLPTGHSGETAYAPLHQPRATAAIAAAARKAHSKRVKNKAKRRAKRRAKRHRRRHH